MGESPPGKDFKNSPSDDSPIKKVKADKKAMKSQNNLEKFTKPLEVNRYYTKKNLKHVDKIRKNKKMNVETVFRRHNTITLCKQHTSDDANFISPRTSYDSNVIENKS